MNRTHIDKILLFFSFLIAGNLVAYTQQEQNAIVIGTYHRIHSEILGEERVLLVHLPEGYDQAEAKYPVLYLLYGDHMTTYFAETVSILDRFGSTGRIPPMILVSIENTDRYRDLIPYRNDGSPTGIDKFQKFFSEELIPWVDENYRTKDYRILVGPQAGANFGLYTMIDEPELFDAYILNHPFRWQSGPDKVWNQLVTFFENNRSFKNFLYITYCTGDDLEVKGEKYLIDLEKFIKQTGPENFRLKLNHLAGNTEFVQPLGLREGIKELFNQYPFPDDLEIQSLDDISEYYQKLSADLGFEVDMPEHVLTMQSDKLVDRGRTAEALRIWEYMRDNYPRPGNAYWRLGNYYKDKEEYELAIKYFKQLIELYPDVAMARRLVEELEKKIEK
jgi:predicted alpha/beta superfamily hydrolase